jgi:hypothetical protein
MTSTTEGNQARSVTAVGKQLRALGIEAHPLPSHAARMRDCWAALRRSCPHQVLEVRLARDLVHRAGDAPLGGDARDRRHALPVPHVRLLLLGGWVSALMDDALVRL